MSSSMPILSGDTGFYNYLKEINSIASLSEEEEYMLAKRYKEHSDLNAAHSLVKSHLKFVAKIALGFRGYGLPVVDLISEGNIGLMQAVKKFDPDKGFRLSTYAMWWIKAAIQEYVLRSWSLVKIGTTAAQKKLFFNLGKIKRRIEAVESRSFSSEDYKKIAEELALEEKEVIDMDRRLMRDFSLDTPIGDSETGYIELLPEARVSQEKLLLESQQAKIKKDLFAQAFATLNEREQHIIRERKLKENSATLEDLSNYYKISKERVRQIEERAMEKMKEFVQQNADKS